MMNLISLLMENKFAIVMALFSISEALSYIPAIKANGIFQLIFGFLSKAKEEVKPAAPAA
jgi:hypothetical protein